MEIATLIILFVVFVSCMKYYIDNPPLDENSWCYKKKYYYGEYFNNYAGNDITAEYVKYLDNLRNNAANTTAIPYGDMDFIRQQVNTYGKCEISNFERELFIRCIDLGYDDCVEFEIRSIIDFRQVYVHFYHNFISGDLHIKFYRSKETGYISSVITR